MKVAINRTVIGKPPREDMGKMTFTYENVDLNQKELADSINLGYAFCAPHKNGHRKSANFTVAGFLAVDVDKGMTVQEALDHEFTKKHAAILYTTPSHTEDFPKFRVVFELKTTITTPDEMKKAYRGIIRIYGGDPSCKDACRQFFGSKDCDPQVFNNILSSSTLDKLILIGEESINQTDTATGSSGPERHAVVSRIVLDLDEPVKDADGTVRPLKEIPVKTSVHCPVHADAKPSAFILKSKKGVLGIYCNACAVGYYTSSDVPIFDFNYALSNLTDLSLEEHETTEGVLVYSHKAVIMINEQYLPELKTDTPITLVKSPKGSGKTQWLEHIVEQCRKQNLSVLLIGHRRSLIQSVAQRLRLMPYLYEHAPTMDDPQSDRLRINRPSKHYAICADSLPTLLDTSDNKYDVVLIDEVEQVFSHLTSNTLKDKRIETFLYFKYYVNAAKYVYAMDADLNELTVNTLHDFVDDKKSREVRVIINRYMQKGKQLDLYDNQAHLLADLVKSVNNNKRCFVCCNSRKQVHTLEEIMVEQFGDNKKVIAISSRNSQDSHIQEFIKNVKVAALEYDVVIVSPSVGTGVDITFPNNDQRIDTVYGFFHARVNTHFDIDQQLSRVRHPKSVKVWISPETFRFDSNHDAIKREIDRTDRHSKRLIGIEPNGKPIYETNDEYLNLYANVKSMQRGSKNNLRLHFKNLKTHEGWTINEVARDEDANEEGLAIARRGKELYQEKLKNSVLNAKIITMDEYLGLRKSSELAHLSSDEEAAMRRYEIESFYYEDVTEDLVDLDNDGKYRRRIRQYERYTRSDTELRYEDILDDSGSTHITDKKTLLARKELLHQLFMSAGLADQDNDLIAERFIESDSLANFAILCEKNKETIARWFEFDIRKNVHDKPGQQLGTFLRLLGITWERSKPIKRDGKKIYRYQISQSVIDDLDAIVSRRLDQSTTQKWHENRNATIENRLFEPEDECDPEADAIFESIRLDHKRLAKERLLEPEDESDSEADAILASVRAHKKRLATQELEDEGALGIPEGSETA